MYCLESYHPESYKTWIVFQFCVLILGQSTGGVSWSKWRCSRCSCPALTGLLSMVCSRSWYQGGFTFQLGRCQRSTEKCNTRWRSRLVFASQLTSAFAAINCKLLHYKSLVLFEPFTLHRTESGQWWLSVQGVTYRTQALKRTTSDPSVLIPN